MYDTGMQQKYIINILEMGMAGFKVPRQHVPVKSKVEYENLRSDITNTFERQNRSDSHWAWRLDMTTVDVF